MEPRAQARTAPLPYMIDSQTLGMHPRMIGHQLVFAAFLLTQILDGILTYAGVSALGISAEGNPLLAWLMASYGEVIALAGAKILAACCGVALYVLGVDRVLAVLTLLYIGAALIPWTLILF